MTSAIEPATVSEEGSYYQAELYTNQNDIGPIPSAPLSIPGSASTEQLNSLLNRLLSKDETDDTEHKEAQFDFLINGFLLRVTIAEFVADHDLSIESVVRIECVLREPAPTPDLDLPHEDWVSAVVANDRTILSGSYDHTVTVWSLKEKERSVVSKLHEGAVKCLTVLSNGSNDQSHTFVSGSQDQTLRVWRLEGPRHNKLVCERVLKGHERSVECVCVNKAGSRIVSGGFDRYLKVWNADAVAIDDQTELAEPTKKRKSAQPKIATQTPMVTLMGHKDAITGVRWSPSKASEVVTVSWDHTIAVWDLELAGQTSTLTGNKAFTSLSISPLTELLVTGSTDKHARLWDPRSKEGSLVKSTFTSHTGWITAVDWSKTRANLFISSSLDGLVKMWDTRSPKAPLYDLCGHEDRVLCADWSTPALIFSGGADCTLKTFTTQTL